MRSEISWHPFSVCVTDVSLTAATRCPAQVPEFLERAARLQEGRYYRLDKVRLLAPASSSWQKSECYFVFSFDCCFHQQGFYFPQYFCNDCKKNNVKNKNPLNQNIPYCKRLAGTRFSGQTPGLLLPSIICS